MTDDIAVLGIKIDSSEVKTADKDLDKLAATSGKAEKATDALSVSNQKSEKATAAASSAYTKLDALLSSADITTKQLSKAQDILNAEYAQGKVSAEQYATAMAKINTASAGAAKGGLSLAKNSAQQFGYQIQDMAVQLQMGTSFMTVFGQQGSQIASIFGPGGAVIGAVIAVGAAIGGTLIPLFTGASESIEKATAKTDKFKERMDSMIASLNKTKISELNADITKVENTIKGIEAEIQKFPNIALVKEDQLQTQYKLLAILRDQKREAEGLNKSFEPESVDRYVQSLNDQVATLGKTKSALADVNKQIAVRQAQEQGASADQIRSIELAFDRIAAFEKQTEAQKKATDAAKKANAEQEKFDRRLDSLIRKGAPIKAVAADLEFLYDAVSKGAISKDFADEIAKNIGDGLIKGTEDGGKEAEKEFRAVAENVGNTLQNTIASGDWSGLGMTVGGIFAGAIGSIVTDTLITTLGSSTFSSVLGPVIGGIAGGIAGLAVSKISDFFSGGVVDPTAQRQAAQGTGSVLGSINDKTKSIVNAAEMTATATSNIVNINTGMLAALTGLKQSITGAVTILAQGASGINIQAPTISDKGGNKAAGALLGGALGGITGGALGGAIGDFANKALDVLSLGLFSGLSKLLGGKSKKIDEGINILGGNITDLTESAIVEAFSTFKVKSSAFSKTKVKEKTERVGSEVEQQISLVFSSIVDSVSAGASALGLSATEIGDALSTFTVEATKVSLEGLNAEEQTAALNAVFGKVFDNLATSVVPFLDKLVIAGEGYGETLARVATQTALVTEAQKTLGFAFDKTAMGVESVSIAAQNIVNAVGGIEAFSSALLGFEKNFLSIEEQTATSARRLTEALGELPLPATRDGFRELLQVQDAATESGQQNIATLLKLQGTANDYYNALESAATDAAEEAQKQADLAQQALDDATAAIEKIRAALVDALNSAVAASNNALSRLQASVNAQKGVIDQIYKDLSGERKTQYQDEVTAIKQAGADRKRAIKSSGDAQLAAAKASEAAQLSAIKATEKANLDANKQAINTAKDALSAISSELGGITSALKSLNDISKSIDVRREDALKTLRSALSSGNFTGAGEAAGVAANINQGDFATAADFRRQVGTTRSLLTKLESRGMSRLSSAEQTIALLETQNQAIRDAADLQVDATRAAADAADRSIKENTDRTITKSDENTALALKDAEDRYEKDQAILDDRYKTEIERLDSIVSNAEDQLNALRGIDASVMSVVDAVAFLGSAIQAERVAAAALDEFNVVNPIPGFASGGQTAGGTIMVGEEGPELLTTGPGYITNNNDSKKLLSNDALIAEVKDLKSMLKSVLSTISINSQQVKKKIDQWDGDGLPNFREDQNVVVIP